MLSMRSLHSATVLYSNSYYTVVAIIFLVSAASCKAICRVASVRTSDYSQLKWHALLMPHVLIKYAHVLIYISAGEGSRHFSAFIYLFCMQLLDLCTNIYFLQMKVTGSLLRKSGAFFIRRPFGNDELYKLVVLLYIETVLCSRDMPVEFYIEGTRSRTAKPLHPKLGMCTIL